MSKDPLFLAVAIAVLVVLGILLLGIASFAKGGEFNKKYSNKIMRWRLAAQFIAILVILAFVALRRGG